MALRSGALKESFASLPQASSYTDDAVTRSRIMSGVAVDADIAGIETINKATKELVRLDGQGRRLDLEIQDFPYEALIKIADGFRDFGLSNALASPLVEAIENYALHLGTDFTRKANPTPLKIHLYVTDRKPELDENSTHFMVAFDGQSMFGGDFSTMGIGLSISGTTSTHTNVPDLDKMFESGKRKYLVFHYETLAASTLQGLDEVSMGLTNLAQAAGPSASGDSLAGVKKSIQDSTITPQQTAIIETVAQLNQTIESARTTPSAETTPVISQLKAKIETLIQSAPANQIPAVLVEAAAKSIQRPEVQAAVPTKVMSADSVNTYKQDKGAAPVKADNENAVKAKAPSAPDAVVATPVANNDNKTVQATAQSSVAKETVKAADVSPVADAPKPVLKPADAVVAAPAVAAAVDAVIAKPAVTTAQPQQAAESKAAVPVEKAAAPAQPQQAPATITSQPATPVVAEKAPAPAQPQPQTPASNGLQPSAPVNVDKPVAPTQPVSSAPQPAPVSDKPIAIVTALTPVTRDPGPVGQGPADSKPVAPAQPRPVNIDTPAPVLERPTAAPSITPSLKEPAPRPAEQPRAPGEIKTFESVRPSAPVAPAPVVDRAPPPQPVRIPSAEYVVPKSFGSSGSGFVPTSGGVRYSPAPTPPPAPVSSVPPTSYKAPDNTAPPASPRFEPKPVAPAPVQPVQQQPVVQPKPQPAADSKPPQKPAEKPPVIYPGTMAPRVDVVQPVKEPLPNADANKPKIIPTAFTPPPLPEAKPDVKFVPVENGVLPTLKREAQNQPDNAALKKAIGEFETTGTISKKNLDGFIATSNADTQMKLAESMRAEERVQDRQKLEVATTSNQKKNDSLTETFCTGCQDKSKCGTKACPMQAAADKLILEAKKEKPVIKADLSGFSL